MSRRDDNRGSEYIELDNAATAYLLGSRGATKQRLADFTGCQLEIGHSRVELIGRQEERELARMCVEITLQQRNGSGRGTIEYDELERREDCSTIDVPQPAVGFLLGAKGATLRQMETKHRVFMFFNNDRVRQGKHVRRRTAPARAHTNRAVQGLIQAIPAL